MGHEQFGPYVLQELIGRGGMGEVFRAWDTVRNRTVALKRLPASLAHDEAFRSRFRTESEVAARLNDPHVLPIHDFGSIGGRLFIDMRFVAGVDLARLLTRVGSVGPEDAIDVLAQVASALDEAHGQDLVHRDVKPSNVLLTLGSSGDVPEFAYLTDFGVAQIGGADTSLSSTNTTAGTFAYMAPERFGGRRASHRVDVYSLGCVLYEMLAGEKPFPVQSMPEAMHAHIYLEPPRASDARPDVPQGLDDVIARAMAKAPEQRYDSCGAMAADARAQLRGSHAPHVARTVPLALEGRETGRDDDWVSSRPTVPRSSPVVTPAATPSPPHGAGSGPGGRGHEHATRVATLRDGASEPESDRLDVPAQRCDRYEKREAVSAGARSAPTPVAAPGRRRPVAAVAVAGVAAVAILAAAALVGYLTSPGESRADPNPASRSVPTVVAAPVVPAYTAPVTAGTYAGRTSGDEMTVAIATRDGKVAAYLCDGESVEAWMQGTLEGNELTLRSPKGATLAATIRDNAAFGTVNAKGYENLSFAADLSAAPAGLYEARSGSTRIGWIVLSDGSRVGLSQTNGVTTPAPPLDTASRTTTLNGSPVVANPVTAGETW